jgi:hypothetical protein
MKTLDVVPATVQSIVTATMNNVAAVIEYFLHQYIVAVADGNI